VGKIIGPSLSKVKFRDGRIIARGDSVRVARPAWSDKIGIYAGKNADGKFRVDFAEHGASQLLCDHAELSASIEPSQVSAPVDESRAKSQGPNLNELRLSGTLEDSPAMEDHPGGWQS
jgi:hypothetical protein